jgi:hypothetical protein
VLATFRLREVNTSVEDVRLSALLILRQDDHEPFLLVPILTIGYTDRPLALLVLSVADATLFTSYPTRRLHSLFGIEILHFLRALISVESDEAYLSLHRRADHQPQTDKNRIRDALRISPFAPSAVLKPSIRAIVARRLLARHQAALMSNHGGLHCFQGNGNPGCLLNVGFANFKFNFGRALRNHKQQRDVL